ncbi:hypothetical protein PG993_014707 [Apiospora rasikravindrae]|uniref:Uncharacterized protein n=1 Tax=Apiospora rasikravindrae TaxID=990691 RepID=A0ABR1RQN9_9PEZI
MRWGRPLDGPGVLRTIAQDRTDDETRERATGTTSSASKQEKTPPSQTFPDAENNEQEEPNPAFLICRWHVATGGDPTFESVGPREGRTLETIPSIFCRAWLRASRGTTVVLEHEKLESIKLVWNVRGARTVSTCFIAAWVRNVARLMSQVRRPADWPARLAAGVEAGSCDKSSRKEQTDSGQRRQGVALHQTQQRN